MPLCVFFIISIERTCGAGAEGKNCNGERDEI